MSRVGVEGIDINRWRTKADIWPWSWKDIINTTVCAPITVVFGNSTRDAYVSGRSGWVGGIGRVQCRGISSSRFSRDILCHNRTSLKDNEGINWRCLVSSPEEPYVGNLQVRVCEGWGRETAPTYSVNFDFGNDKPFAMPLTISDFWNAGAGE